MLYDEYESYMKKYKEEFGEQTIVLYECGSFFEIYDDGQGLVNMKEISELLNIIVSRRNKAILEVSRNNFEMAGFPSHSLKKFISILLSNNYTIVMVTQTTPPPNPKRAVTEILSPGTSLDINYTDSNNLMVIYFEENERYKSTGYDVSIGCSIIDLSTGKSDVLETSSFGRDQSYPYDEIHRIVSIYNPREVEVVSARCDHISMKVLTDHIDFGRACVHDKIGRIDKNIVNKSYQESTISSVFKNRGILSGIEYINLERKPIALISYVRMLQFVSIHNESIIQNIKKPGFIEEQNTLLLSYNAAQQLDIINSDISNSSSSGKKGSLLSILNNSKTAIGRRYFKKRLLNPYINVVDIVKYYDEVDGMSLEVMTEIREKLSKIYDIERLYRKCVLGLIQPQELSNLLCSIQTMGCITEVDILGYTARVLNLDKLILYNGDGDIFVEGYNSTLSDYQNLLRSNTDHLHSVVASIFTTTGFRLENTEKDGYFISSTSKRYNDLSKGSQVSRIVDGITYNLKDFTCKNLSSSVKISHPRFDAINDDICMLKGKIAKVSESLYKTFISDFTNKFEDDIEKYISYIEKMDFLSTMRYNNHIFRLSRPEIKDSVESYVLAKGIRHLIIEQNQPGIKYVENDMNIGTDDSKGMLLYGINSAGKSSLMKSIGIVVLMAQAGMYVPCESMTISPYKKIFTRIISSDDIFRGQSTFTKEIIELRNILQRSDANSLVIGDELCSGTESISALSIVSAGVVTLSKKLTSFVFATHLHDLVKVDDITELKNVKTCHLSVTYDEQRKVLVYDRKLKEGNGSTLYGIEVCKSLDLDKDFLDLANSIRHKMMNNNLPPKKSIYNSQMYTNMKECSVCKTRSSEEVHHIHEQHKSDKDGYISTFHKNSLFNLVSLCGKCHDDVHSGKITIHGFVQTSQGRELFVGANKNITAFPTREELEVLLKQSVSKKEFYDKVCKEYNITKYRADKILSI